MIRIIYFIPLLLLCWGCNDFLNEEPEVSVTNNNYWKTEQDVESAVYGMHLQFRYAMGNGNPQDRDRGVIFDMLPAPWLRLVNNDLRSFYQISDSRLFWRDYYNVICLANSILDNISRASLPEERYRFYLGQTLVVRAWVYFYIICNWGDAPWIEHNEDVGEKGRIPWQKIAEYIISDLKKAIELLPRAYDLQDSKGKSIESKQIPSKGTAHAILAQVYAWKAGLNREPELNRSALAECDSVVSDPSYDLVGSIREVCEAVMLGNSREGIFELDFGKDSDGDLSLKGGYSDLCQRWPVLPLTTPATYSRSQLAISSAAVYRLYPDKTDQRREEYFYKLDSMAGVSTAITRGRAYIRKIRHVVIYVGGPLDGRLKGYEDNQIIIRLADILLLRAELRAKTGDTGGAIADLNRVRRRAGAAEYPAGENDLKEAIAVERDRELFCEGITIRFFDILRNGTFREKLRGGFKTLTDQDVADGALFLPVGKSAFFNNTLMRQNIYWKKQGFQN